MQKKIEVIAPTRIDLTGGTLDIWPLYLYFDNPITINLAVSFYANTKIGIRNDKKIIIISQDQKKKMEFDSVSLLRHNHKLNLITELISFFNPTKGLTVETRCEAPAGAGLAGSSALNISLCYSLNKLTGERYNKTQLQSLAKNIEARVLKAPAGDQDYFPALYGGLNSLELTPEGIKRVSLKSNIRGLRKRILIAYSGKSRNSGINNWEIYKKVIDGDKKVRQGLQHIANTSLLMKNALTNCDLDSVGTLIAEEWKNRKQLWKEVSTPEIEGIISIGNKNGAMAAKVCGAGGGGCILFYSKDGEFDRLKQGLVKRGIKCLDFSVDSKGVRVISRMFGGKRAETF